MSWNAKVHWSEGLFLRPHHFQQADRYLETALEARTRYITPYPWGFAALEIDRDLAQQARFALRRGAGIMPDGALFDFPAESPGPAPIEVPESAAGQLVWLTLPARADNTREVSPDKAENAARFVVGAETIIDSTSHLRIEEEIEVAYPRFAYEVRKTAKPGYVGLPIARIVEVHDRTLVFDEKFAPPVLICAAHPTIEGWLDRVIGWVGTKLDELARYAADATAGGGLQSADYLMLQMLNRETPVLAHFRQSRAVHPERLYEEFLRIAGELATFATQERRAREYPGYDHENLEGAFAPLMRDIQDFLSARLDRRAIRLELIERAPNAFISTIRDRTLFRNATLILEVSARRPLSEIQQNLPAFLKVGPNTKMNEIVHAHLPGVTLVHLPTPPPQIRAITDHVYFYFDRTSPLWPEFSIATAIGMHFAGDWPELQMELWAVREDEAMSDNDDPFGRRDRTIIRPNPGGRRSTSAPAAPAPAPQGGAPPASAPLPPVGYPSQPGPAPSSGEWDAWMNAARGAGPSPYLQASAASAPMTPAPSTPHISVDFGTVTANPLMRAAASLLLLIGRLRAGLSRGAPAQLMDQVAQAIQQFEVDARAASAPADQIAAAKYALAATADDIVQNLPGEGGGVWTQYSMLVRFFAERTGGVKFFQELERAKQHPTVNLGLLELMHACLSLGFEGVYRTGGGAGAVQGVRRDLYETIRRAAPRLDDDLSPHWRGQTIALAGRRFQMPVWSIAAVAAAILFAVYLILRNMLIGQAEALAFEAATAHPAGDVDIARETYVPPPPPPKLHISTQLERIRAALADEILAGKVGADQTATSIFIRITSVVLFPKGGAVVNDSFAPIAKKIAASLDKEPGEIRIDGYTDSDPITTVAFASNFELSQARAKGVAAMLKPSLSHPERIVVAGKGTANPVAPNDSEANKSKNRRVEISIPRAD